MSGALGAALSLGGNPLHLAGNAFVTGLLGCALTLFEMALQGPFRERLQAVPFAIIFTLRMLVYGGLFGVAPAAAGGLAAMLSPAEAAEGAFGVGLGPSILIALVFNMIFAARALLGPRTLLAFVTGRYHRPRCEQRLVLFLDLHGSTALAERLGDLEFHRFLNRLVLDVTEPVAEAGGEVYRYIGDEIIVTWGRNAESATALECLFAIDDVLRRRQADYAAAFGAAPRLRGGLHAGPVVVGEMGEAKREIVILGDTMNTTARIVEVCRETGRDHIASAAALAAMDPLPTALRVEALGAVRLRGKEEPLELFALSRAAPAREPAPVRRADISSGDERVAVRTDREAAGAAVPGAPAR